MPTESGKDTALLQPTSGSAAGGKAGTKELVVSAEQVRQQLEGLVMLDTNAAGQGVV